MSEEHFETLGLSPGRYSSAEITRRFERQRRTVLQHLHDPAGHAASRSRLDALHRAHALLRDPARQEAYLAACRADDDVECLRRLIESALEGGLLRYERRRQLLREGRRLGFSDFHTQLLIAQVQFGEQKLVSVKPQDQRPRNGTGAPILARFAAASVLAYGLFLFMIRWLER